MEPWFAYITAGKTNHVPTFGGLRLLGYSLFLHRLVRP